MNNEEYRRYESNDTVDNVKHSNLQHNDYAYKETYDTMRIPTTNERVKPINCDDGMSVTSLADLQHYTKGSVVRFPDFAEGQPFVARVKRPSMLMLAKMGKIPNALLNSATQLFTKGGSGMDTKNERTLSDMYSICETIARASLVQPTYDEILDSGMTLSDDQMMAIFNYTQGGVKALENFRDE